MGEANKDTGRLNLNVGPHRKAAFERACELREVGMTAALVAWIDRFITLTPHMPKSMIPPPLDADVTPRRHTAVPPATRPKR